MYRSICTIVAVILCGLGNGLMAQPASGYTGESTLQTNLFEYGTPVSTAATNLENLFANWPKSIRNSDILDLVSYEYIGTVKNRRQLKSLLKKNINARMPMWNINYAYGKETNGIQTQQHPSIRLLPTDNDIDKQTRQAIVDTVAEVYVGPGDMIFRIKFVLDLQQYDYYVFIKQDTKKAVLKGNIFGFSI